MLEAKWLVTWGKTQDGDDIVTIFEQVLNIEMYT